MKITNILLVALLVNDSSAIRIRDDDLDLPVLQDQHDLAQDKKILEKQKDLKNAAKEDNQLIETFEKQLDQALRNAEQGEMGRALAVSKLQQIKLNISTLEHNLKTEGNDLISIANETLEKHQPQEMSTAELDDLSRKTSAVLAQIPKINQLEHNLEIQDEDAELAKTKNSLSKINAETRDKILEGNKNIREKVNKIPEGAKILTEKQYEDSMAFVLKH